MTNEKQTEIETLKSPKDKSDLEYQFPVPRGWTTLIHGTDSSRWQLGEKEKVIKGFAGLSAITSEDQARNRADAIRLGNPSAFDTTASYARSVNGENDTVPVEVRIFFYREDLSPRHKTKPDITDIKASIPPATSDLIQKYYQPRHAVVPRGETLIQIGGGIDEESQRIVEYFVPASIANEYKAATDIQAEL